jgi:hypothetical protein
MCERLAAYIEGDLSPDERSAADQHLAECATCAEALVELRAIAGEAAQLPLLTPSRDLWTGIESRITTPVTRLDAARTAIRRAPRRQWQMAIAAGALITVSAGATYLLTARSGATGARQVTVAATTTAAQPTESLRTATPAATPAPTTTSVAPTTGRLIAGTKNLSATRVYDREITLLDSLVRTRRESLDPETVHIIERNLRIIDSAIAESRAALARDPKSPMLTNRLDNVLGSKVDLLRTIAFLPSQS